MRTLVICQHHSLLTGNYRAVHQVVDEKLHHGADLTAAWPPRSPTAVCGHHHVTSLFEMWREQRTVHPACMGHGLYRVLCPHDPALWAISTGHLNGRIGAQKNHAW